MALSSYLNIESKNYWALMAIFIYYCIFIYYFNLYYYNYYIFIYYYNNIIDCILCVCWWGVDGNRGKPLRHLKVIPSSLQTYSVLFVIDWKSIGKHMPDLRHSRNIKIFGQEPLLPSFIHPERKVWRIPVLFIYHHVCTDIRMGLI